MATWKKVVVSGSIAQLANETFISGHITASGIVKAEHLFSTDDAQITDDLIVGGDIDLEGSIDVNGTANLDAVDIDGAVNIAATTTVATNNKISFRDAAIYLASSADGQLDIVADDEVQIAATTLDINGNVDISGTTAIGDDITVATNKKIQFRDTAIFINSDADGHLELVADTGISFKIGSTEQFILTDGAITPTTTNDVDLGSATKKFKNLFLTGDVTASGHMHVVGDITSSAKIKAEHLHSTDDASIADDLTVGGDAAVTGTLTAGTFSPTSILNTSLVVGRDSTDQIKFSTNDQIIFRVGNADNVIFKASGEIEASSLDISGNVDVDGTMEADAITVNGTALNTVIAGVTVTNATTAAVATTVTITDNENTNEENALVFTAGGDIDGGNLGLEADGTATYNPSTGTITATIFKGNIDAVDGDFDGTLEADAITVGGTALNTVIAGVTVTNSTNAAHVLITDNESTDEHNQLAFIEGAAGGTANRGLEADGHLTYNPSKGLVIAPNFSASGHIHAAGDVTASGIFKGEGLIITDDALITDDLTVNGDIDLAGSIDVDGTMEADAITVGGTALNTVIAGVTVTNATNAAHVLITDNESTNEHNQITFIEGAGGGGANRGLEADGHLTYNPSKGLVIAPNFSASGHIHAVGDITSSATIKAEHLHSTDDASIADDLTVGGDAAVTGTLTAGTFSPTSLLNTSLVVGRDSTDQIKFSTNDQIIFRVGNADGVIFKASGEIEATSLDISGNADIAGNLTGLDNVTSTNYIIGGHTIDDIDITAEFVDADAHIMSSKAIGARFALKNADTTGTATNATNAAHVLITDNEDTNEHNQITFIEGAGGGGSNRGLEADGHLTYNPSKGLVIAPNFSASGHIHAVGDITASAALKGATGVIAGALAAATLNTGQGANELYAMNQNVRSSDAVVFTTVNTGQGANELYGMDQAVKTNSNVTFADLQVDGDLVVAGTASFTNTTNLEIKDRFISLASGSTSVGDGGIVVNHFGGAYPSGSAFGYEGGTANRWAVQNEFAPTGSTFAPDAYMGIVTFSTSAPSGNPTYGGANYGYGNIHVETDTGDIFIFA